MPGVKRKASVAAPFQPPQKLKKQSTSVAVDRAIATLNRKKSTVKSPVKLPRTSSLSPRKKLPLKNEKKPLPMPRFPTLKPTKPPTDPDVLSTGMFYGSPKSNLTPSGSFTKLKRDKTVLLKENSVTTSASKLNKKLSKKPANKLTAKSLSKKSSAALQTPNAKTNDSEGTITSSGMNSSLRKLASGSIIGRIIKDDGLGELTLPSDTSLAVYEFSEDAVGTPSLNSSRNTATPARQSAFDVATFFASTSPPSDDKDKMPPVESGESSSDSEGESSSQNENLSLLTDSESSLSKVDSSLKNGVSPTKSPRKGLRGGVREIVFSFDTTGSMYNYMEAAREKIKEIVNRLQTDIPGVRLGFLAHGDYYDLNFDRYLIKWINFGANVDEISEFFEDLGNTHGGDPEECYELVLRRVQDPNYMAWTPGSQRTLVMIGDSDPHEPGYTFDGKVNEIDWRQETEKLRDMGVRIYGLQIGYGSDFYRQISKVTGGAHLRLDSASFMPDVVMAICLREGNLKLLKHYESEVRSRAKKEGNSVDLELERLFSALKNIEDNKAFRPDKKTPSKSPSKSPSKKVKLALGTHDSKKIAAVKRTLTPFIATSAKKAKLDDTESDSGNESTETLEELVDMISKKIAFKEKSVKEEISTLLVKAVKKKTVKSTSPKAVKEKNVKQAKKSTLPPKAKTLKVPAKKTAVDRGKKVKRLEKSTKGKLSLKKVSKPSPKKVDKKVPAKKSSTSAKKKVEKKGKGKAVSAQSKQKTNKSKKEDMKKKSSPKSVAKTKKPAKKEIVKKVAIKSSGKSKVVKRPATSKKPVSKAKVSKTTVKTKATKISTKSKSVKAQVKAKVGRPAAKPKVSKISPKSKSVKALVKAKVGRPKAKPKVSSMKGKAKITKAKLKVSKMKAVGKPGRKAASKPTAKTAKPKAVQKPKAAATLKPSPKAKANVKQVPKKVVRTPVKVKQVPKKVVRTPVKKTTVPTAKKSPKTDKSPVSVKSQKKDVKKETKVVNSPQAKGENGRLYRENVAGSNFATGPLSSLSWTQWSVFVSPTKPKENSDKFVSPKGWCSGYCNNELFRSDGIIQAVYEFAVAPPGGTKKYPVFYCATAGSSKANVKECLKNNKMKKEMDRAVKAKGTIFIRKGAFSACNLAKLKATKDYIKENFNYAWGGNDQAYRKSGDVVKDGFVILKS